MTLARWALRLGAVAILVGCRTTTDGADGPVEPSPGPVIAPYDTIPSTAATTQCKVESITDGDTFRCVGGVRVRLLTIDTPEMSQTPYGALARQKLAELLPVGETVTLELDVQHQDQYGRTLAYVRRPRMLVNRELVRAGVAVVAVYPPNVRYVDVLRAAADSARADSSGFWGTAGFQCLPADHRAGRC